MEYLIATGSAAPRNLGVDPNIFHPFMREALAQETAVLRRAPLQTKNQNPLEVIK